MADALSAHPDRQTGSIVLNLQFQPSAAALACAEEVRQRIRRELGSLEVSPSAIPPKSDRFGSFVAFLAFFGLLLLL